MDATVEDGLAGVLAVELDAGESVLAASGAIVDHTGGVRVERAREGALRSVANAARQREVTPVKVTATEAATARFAPRHHGEVAACGLDEGTVSVARDAFLAAPAGVRVGAGSIGNAPTRGMGLFLTQLTGDGGAAYVAGRGRVERVALAEGESRVVAAANVVAFEDRVGVTVERVSAMEDAASVGRFHGPGAVWLSTRRRE
ncbi:AIM24 family protein [Halobacterium rubrum]|uniref:AIM24 family protein n=1 Tax=Halobacterium TaxID=2239 RepID=UPI001F3EDEBB|nr:MULTISPECIES: AIM24 family protein [Halobacterium]MDH5020543.1 AIM24 family protein [Halobacterium rubrum]